VKVADRSLAPSGPAKRTADEGDPSHVPAPMPGLVVSLSVRIGEAVARGDRLLSIEAMKMETGVFAERAGAVREILVKAGDQVDTKQLLMVIGEDAAEASEDGGEDAGDAAGSP
jgi:pyruvate carboxylase